MKSLSLNAPGSVTVVEQDVDQSFSMMAVLRVISSGVCAADSYLWSGNHPWDITYPIVPGHEIFGEVIEVNPDEGNNLEVGSKVAVQVNIPCYTCELCKKNKFNMCTVRKHFGSTFKGSFAEKIAIPVGARVYSYAGPIDDMVGGLSETMANAIYCSRKIDLNKNIRYQDTSISSGMWRYTGKEQGGKGVYRNLNNGQILGFDRSDFDIFRNNLSSHFDISESINEDIYYYESDWLEKMSDAMTDGLTIYFQELEDENYNFEEVVQNVYEKYYNDKKQELIEKLIDDGYEWEE